MGKPTISMAIFNSNAKLPESIPPKWPHIFRPWRSRSWCFHQKSPFHHGLMMAFSQSPDFFKHTDLADCKACLADGSRHRLIALAAALKSNEDFSCFCLKIWRIPSILHESKFGEPNPCRFLDMNPRYGRLMERWGSLGSLSPSRYPRSYGMPSSVLVLLGLSPLQRRPSA